MAGNAVRVLIPAYEPLFGSAAASAAAVVQQHLSMLQPVRDSVTLDLLRRSSIPRLVAAPLHPVGRGLDRLTRPFGLAEYPLHKPVTRQRVGDAVFAVVVAVLVALGVWRALGYIRE